MKTYVVTLRQIVWDLPDTLTYTVEATNENDAIDRAMDIASDQHDGVGIAESNPFVRLGD